jgi:catechol 2,3-dioxygenase-like lactoylglutathione lyase family enzyme
MLADKDGVATIAVKSAKAAKQFYEGKLGFKPVERLDRARDAADSGENGMLLYKSGKTTVLVYESQYAGTNKATSATWGVGEELEDIVKTLKSKGVAFEHYDLPGLTRKGDVHVAGEFKAAWFKDPDGNILHINNA